MKSPLILWQCGVAPCGSAPQRVVGAPKLCLCHLSADPLQGTGTRNRFLLSWRDCVPLCLKAPCRGHAPASPQGRVTQRDLTEHPGLSQNPEVIWGLLLQTVMQLCCYFREPFILNRESSFTILKYLNLKKHSNVF